MVPLYAARVRDLGPGDFVECGAVGVTGSYTPRRYGARPLAWNKDRDMAAASSVAQMLTSGAAAQSRLTLLSYQLYPKLPMQSTSIARDDAVGLLRAMK
jgi:hypothetical protein